MNSVEYLLPTNIISESELLEMYKIEKGLETLEQAAERYANELPDPYNYGINHDKKKGFIEGAKWQHKRKPLA